MAACGVPNRKDAFRRRDVPELLTELTSETRRLRLLSYTLLTIFIGGCGFLAPLRTPTSNCGHRAIVRIADVGALRGKRHLRAFTNTEELRFCAGSLLRLLANA